MGPIWGRQDLGGPHAGPMNFAIWGSDAQPRDIAHGTHGNMGILIALDYFCMELQTFHAMSFCWIPS